MDRAYIIRRFLQMVLTLWVVFTIIFATFQLVPADPTALLVHDGMSPEAAQRQRELWGVDQPVLTQYWTYLTNIATGNLGVSFFYRRPVVELLMPFLFNTLALMVPSILLATLLAITVGSYLGLKRGSRTERWGVIAPLVMHNIPTYWLGMLVVMAFAFWMGIFPSSGMRSYGYEADSVWQIYVTIDFLRHLALPMLTAIIAFVASPLLLMRSSMIEVRNEEYLTVIRAKGVPERTAVRHAVRNALLPVVTFLALFSTVAVTGSILIEVVFAWPGLGRAMVHAVHTLDYPMAQAIFFLASTAVIVVYFVVDILYYKLDPRISYR